MNRLTPEALVTKLALALVVGLVPNLAFADKNLVDGDASWSCNDDPVVNITASRGTFALTGACTTVTIGASGVVVDAEEVGELDVNGSKNSVTVGVVDAVNVNGTSNHVTWRRARSGDKPAIASNGTGNVIKKARPAPRK
jgi:hypothetical protein